ncbi:MAG: hypothetical protein WC835_01820 [Candidatus Paceibacterota bacterium]|jgi:hypothetical protein
MNPGVVGIYIRCHLVEKGGGRYIRAIVTNGQRVALIGGNPDLWEILEERVRRLLQVPEGEMCSLVRAIWEPSKSPEEILTKQVIEVDFSEESPPPEVWLAMVPDDKPKPSEPGST